ncbi:uncharacterized protein LOC142378116 [Odontesthes bonariensis]|uniref:uncharacterized protein LOC142378116 n=1 Tax=Odontesthes bonariensis TaxID=219752 RepID=UPI003F58C24F
MAVSSQPPPAFSTETSLPLKKQGTDNGRYPAYCYNCSQKGHFGHECTRQKMFKGVYPSIPFISYYDTVEDINCRQHRIKLKAKTLRKMGYLAAPSETPLPPGPPKKKQRVSHHKNNYQPHNAPQQTPNSHKATPSHIFFNDKFRDSTPKTKKLKQQEGVGSVKPWKPKRPVPTSRAPLPPAKLVLDEADDFPRGGMPEENTKKKKKKRNKMKHVPLSLPDGQRDRRPENLCRTGTGTGRRQGSASKHQRVEKKRNRRNRADKNLGAQMYPADENLFIIKQRKRRR